MPTEIDVEPSERTLEKRRVSDRKDEWMETDYDREAFEASLDDPTLIDCHVHLGPRGEWPDSREETVESTFEWMDEYGVDKVVTQPLESPGGGVSIPTWWGLELAQEYPDRIIPFCCVDPSIPEYRGMNAYRKRIRKYIDRGAMGFGEYKIYRDIDDVWTQMLYEICAEEDLPILFHLDDRSCMDDPGLPGLEAMLQKFPEVDFIMHAHGWWAHIDADVKPSDWDTYPDRPIAPGGRVDDLLSTYDNCYGDVSATSGWNALTRDPEYGQEFLEEHHNSLIWGTDFAPSAVPQFSLFDRFDLPAEAWENIRFRNFESVLPEGRA